MTTVLVTGAAGNVGREVVKACAALGMSVIAADHRPERLPDLGPGVVARQFDYRVASTWPGAVSGADHLFLVRPPAISDVDKTLNPFVAFARSRGVDHVVFLSVAGAGENRFVPHREVEDHLRALNTHYTNLRPGFFAQNLQSAYRLDIVRNDRIYVPAGTAPVNWIDVRDVAEVAALIFSSPERHRGKNYTLAGPGPVSWNEVVELLSAAVGRSIVYEPASLLGYVRHLTGQGWPRGAVFVQTVLHFLLRFNQGATIDATMEGLLGRPGRSIGEYIADHRHVWARSSNGSAASASGMDSRG